MANVFVPLNERKNRDLISKWEPISLAKYLGWNKKEADMLTAEKKTEPNHRRNRAKNKAARKARRYNRGR